MLKICKKLLVKQWKKTKESLRKSEQNDTYLLFRFLFEWKPAASLVKLLSTSVAFFLSNKILVLMVFTDVGSHLQGLLLKIEILQQRKKLQRKCILLYGSLCFVEKQIFF